MGKTESLLENTSEKWTARTWLESDEYAEKKRQLNVEINSNVFHIDYSVFQKSPEEKEKLLNMKWANLEERQRYYGIGNTNKYLNIPSRQLPGGPIRITK